MEKSIFTIAVEGAVVYQDRYLVIERSMEESHAAGLLCFPGGSVEPGGNQTSILEDTLRRELWEETGITVRDEMVYLESARFPMDDGRLAVSVTFLCQYASGNPTARDPAEVAEVQWMTADAIIEDDRTPSWLHATIELAEVRRLELGW